MKFGNSAKLSALPLSFIAVNAVYLAALFPAHSAPPGYDQDPAYMYLFNGLLLIDGQGPWQVDHPGTPLQLLCGISILIARLVFQILGRSTGSSLVDDVLADPESYLYVISWVLLLMNAGALFYLGSRVLRASGRVLLAGLCQLSGLAFSTVTPKASYVAPEALLIFSVLCLLGLLTPLIFARSGVRYPDGGYHERLAGVLCGLGLAVKLTFLPLIGLILIYPSAKILRAAGWAVLAFLILVAPAAKNQARFSEWIWNITTHSGIHGSGARNVFDLSNALQNLKTLLIWYPAFYAVFLAMLAYVLYCVRKSPPPDSEHEQSSIRFAVVALLVVAAQTVLVLKHPGAHYMVPVLPLAFVALAWLLFQFDRQPVDGRRSNPAGARVLFAGIAIAYGCYAVVPTIRQIDRMREQRVAQDSALAIIDAKIREYPGAVVVCAFRCTMPKYATALGLIYAPGLGARPVVRPLLENFFEYNFLVKEFIAPGFDTLTLEGMAAELARGRTVLLVTPKDYPDLSVFEFRTIVSTPPLTLYQVTGIRLADKR